MRLPIVPPFRIPRKPLDPNVLSLDMMLHVEESRSRSSYKGKRQMVDRYLEVQYLVDLEQKLQKKYGENPFPFGALMASLSPLYARIFKIASDLKLQMQPTYKARFQRLEEFDPFTPVLSYAGIKKNLEWFLGKPVDSLMLTDLKSVVQFNVSTHHELLHIILTKLIAPPKHEKNLKHYFYFIEALVFLNEWYLSRELGYKPSLVFSSINCSYRAFEPNERTEDMKPEERFASLFLNHLASLHRWTEREKRKRLPKFGSDLKRPENKVGFQPVFVNRIAHNWFQIYAGRSYPEAYLKAKIHPYTRLHWEKFDPRDLCQDPDSLHRLWKWVNKLLYRV